jgi:diacylglycerol kinase (ATP)
MPATIALIAHDRQKEVIVDFARRHAPLLARYKLVATSVTGQRIQADVGLKVQCSLSGPLGGYVQIAAQVATGNIAAVIVLLDPLSAHPCEADIQALLRICNLYDVPFATNLATAEAIATKLASTLVAHLIFNPVSGQGDAEQELSIIRKSLEPHLHLEVHLTTIETSPEELAQSAIAAHADLVIASGGDGTVSAVAGALIGTGIPLGIVPRGTANAFSVALGIPTGMNSIRNACQVILAGNVRKVDIARCNGLPMILLAGVGFEAETVEKASRELKNQWGALAYLMAGWQAMNEQSLFDTEIEIDGKIQAFQTGVITIANAAPPTSVLAQGAGQVIWDDGLLDVTIATADGKLQGIATMLSMFGAAMIKTSNLQQNVIHFAAKRIKVTTNPPQKVVLDGEIIGTTPIEVECIPNSLTVLMPKA